MSLNKWKGWHVENSEDVLKIDKNLVTTKRGSCDQFLAKLIFWYFSSLRSTKEVTIENMSLNKWKAWHVENSEDVLKFDKKIMT